MIKWLANRREFCKGYLQENTEIHVDYSPVLKHTTPCQEIAIPARNIVMVYYIVE